MRVILQKIPNCNCIDLKTDIKQIAQMVDMVQSVVEKKNIELNKVLNIKIIEYTIEIVEDRGDQRDANIKICQDI